MISVVEVIATGVREVIRDGRSLDQVTSFWLKQNRHWSKFDKGFFAETLAEVVRWWRLLNEFKFVTDVNYGSEYHNAVANYMALHSDIGATQGLITPLYAKSKKSL